MGTRALRKLREQEWEKQLAAKGEEEEKSESSEDEPVVVSKPRNAFDMLNDADEEDDEDEDEEMQTDRLTPQQAPVRSSTPSSTGKKKKKKKPKKKTKGAITPQTADSVEASEDEIDKALKELAIKKPVESDNQPSRSSEDIWEEQASKHLRIDPRSLDPVNEMRALFGNVALEDERSQQQPTRRREVNLQGGVDLETALSGRYNRSSKGRELGSLAKRRNCFVQGKEHWPQSTSGGLSMEVSTTNSWKKSYSIIHNDQYKQAQREFEGAVESMQAEALIAMLQVHPYHVASLVQVAEIAKHQGDASLCGDLLQRSLYTFGRSVHSSFPAAIRDGVARLDFTKSPNRELYLSIFRWLRNLEQRGTYRAAFEWCKLLLALDPITDPFGMTLMIDQLALRGRQHEQFLDMVADEAFGNTWTSLPNICISKALALHRSGKTKEARQQLALSIHRYPYIIGALASAIEVDPVPKSLWGKTAGNDAEKLHQELYVSRAADLWRTPETIGLISEVANTMKYYNIDQSPAAPLQISLEEARHVMALESPSAIALLPRAFTTMRTSNSDVLPPPTSDDNGFTRRAPEASREASFFQRLTNNVSDMFQWFTAPGAAPHLSDEQRAAQIAELRAGFGPDAADVPDQVLERMIQEHIASQFGDLDDEEIAQAFQSSMAGGFDYYGDRPDDEPEDMPELEEYDDAPLPNVTVSHFNPRAATVEEDEEEDPPQNSTSAPERTLLHRVDEDDSPALDLRRPVTRSTETPTIPATSSTPVAQPPVLDDEDIEGDPQRLQRWLISTGLEELRTNPNMSTYIRRLKMLRSNQQTWIISMIKQRGSSDLATKVQNAL